MQTSNETLMFSHNFVNQAHASVHVDKLFWWMMGCCTKLRLRTPWWWQGIISCLRIVYSARLGLALKITNDHTDGKCLLNLKISGSKIRIKKKKEPWNRMNGMRYTFVGFFVTFSLFRENWFGLAANPMQERDCSHNLHVFWDFSRLWLKNFNNVSNFDYKFGVNHCSISAF